MIFITAQSLGWKVFHLYVPMPAWGAGMWEADIECNRSISSDF